MPNNLEGQKGSRIFTYNIKIIKVMSYNKGKNWKKQQQKNNTYIKNELGFQVYMNPNKDKSVKETKILNKLASICEKEIYKTDRKNINAGFELNPTDFKWEYHVDYFNSRLVLKEFEDGMVYMWMYLGNKDKFDTDYEGYISTNMNALVKQVVDFCMGSAINYSGQEVEFKQIEVE